MIMKNENEKKGFFERLLGSKKAKKGSCCCGSFEIEELPEGKDDNPNGKTPKDKKGNSCCN